MMEFIAGNEKRFLEFISGLNEKDKIALICHNDLDGLTSGAIIAKVVGKLDFIKFSGYGFDMLSKLIPELKKRKINKVIIADMNIDNSYLDFKEFQKYPSLIIDHHMFREDLNSGNMVYIKTETDIPACHACYYLFNKIQKIDSWIAALGIVADRPNIYGKENAQEVYRDHGLENQDGDIYGHVIKLGYVLSYFRNNEEKVFEMIMRAKKLDDLKALWIFGEKIEEDVKKKILDFEKNSEKRGDLWVYEYDKKYSISSLLSTSLSLRYSDKTIIILAKEKDIVRISSRRQDGKVNLPELLNKAIRGIENSSCGGHISAAGGDFPMKELKRFKQQLISAYEAL